MEFLRFLENIRTPSLTLFFRFWTLFGEEMLIFGIICVLFWCADKKLAYRIAFTMFISGLLVQGMKIIFRVERPWIRDPTFKAVDGATLTATGYSFPSGHTQGAASFFGTLAFRFGKIRYKALCVIVILMVGLSRMYLGVHTLADVVVSMVVTLFTAWLCSFVFDRYLYKTKYDLIVAVIFSVLSISVAVLALVLLKIGHIETEHVSDCFKLAGAGLGAAAGWYIERNFIDFDVKAKNLLIQLLKIAFGLAVAMILKSGLKLLLGDSNAVNLIRYFATVMWILAVYPFIIKKIMKKRS